MLCINTCMRDIITLLEAKDKPQDIEIVQLSYADSDLAPVLSKDNFKFHYGILAHGYADRFNNKQGDANFNYAGYFLHNIFFTQFRSPRRNNIPIAPLGNFIKSKYGSWDSFTDKFTEQALTVQGSGWIYLATDGKIKIIPNHQVRDDIVILVDLWEHSYQNDYGADKSKYIDNIWRIMDWNMLNSRFGRMFK